MIRFREIVEIFIYLALWTQMKSIMLQKTVLVQNLTSISDTTVTAFKKSKHPR